MIGAEAIENLVVLSEIILLETEVSRTYTRDPETPFLWALISTAR